jgi:hypothetical protein
MKPANTNFLINEFPESFFAGNSVSLIGAGFSRASNFHLPVSIGFLERKWNHSSMLPQLSPELGQLQNRLPEHVEKALDRIEGQYGALRHLDLETVITGCFLRAEGIGKSWEHAVGGGDVSQLGLHAGDYSALLDFIKRRLTVDYQKHQECSLLRRFVLTVTGEDSIISLNYDTLLEHAIKKYAKQELEPLVNRMHGVLAPFTLGWMQSAPKAFRTVSSTNSILAKLHGSIDWISCADKACPNYNNIDCLDHSYLWPPDPQGRYCAICGGPPQIVIIPPTASKSFDRFLKLKIMWSRACTALANAGRWSFLGISFAPNDRHFLEMLRTAGQYNSSFSEVPDKGTLICVVNKSLEEAKEAAIRLISNLAPKCQTAISVETCHVCIFDSIDRYLEIEETIAPKRKEILVERKKGFGK